ncbi:MAG: hypothetical protein BWZ02_02043 [Lentisphaerae bacterium ADurb.BinA184]|nr:MAG: hypothetical protein BWZ02_02043 [Lentisphaerae bacterium ADurb.BinA184]
MNEHLLLENVRGVLVRLEETIIFALIERAQFRRNGRVYVPGAFGPAVGGENLTGYLLQRTEIIHAGMRRYTSPDEMPFFHDLPEPLLPPLRFDESPLRPNAVNINPRIRLTYEAEMVPLLCPPGDDQQYGSTAVCDVACLQALSKRIHYGKFVAEGKYRRQESALAPLIAAGDGAALCHAITDPAVEAAVLERVERKARNYSREVAGEGGEDLPDRIREVYRRWVIPLTKDVETEYLLARRA